MKAIVIKPFRGLPDRETTVRDFAEGDEVSGDLARVALSEGWAVADDDEAGDVEQPPPPPAKSSGKSGKKKVDPDAGEGV